MGRTEKKESGDIAIANHLLALIAVIAVCVSGFYAVRAFLDFLRNRASSANGCDYIVSTKVVNPEDVRSLRINWGSGSVCVGKAGESGAGDEILVRETYPDTGEDDHPLQIEIKQGEIIVGLGTKDASIYPETSRHLEVLLPSGMEELDAIRATMSAGECEVTQIGCAQLHVEASSGRISIHDVTADKLRLAVSSGNANVKGTFSQDMNLEVSSGSIRVADRTAPRRCMVKVGAGMATLALPRNASFAARVRVDTGAFDLGFAYRDEGDTFLVGKGDAEINMLEADVGTGSLCVEPI